MSRFCDNCGVPLRDTALFCPNCGSRQAFSQQGGVSVVPTAPVAVPQAVSPSVENGASGASVFRNIGNFFQKHFDRSVFFGVTKSLISWVLFFCFLFGTVVCAKPFVRLLQNGYQPYIEAVNLYFKVAYEGSCRVSDVRRLAPVSYWERGFRSPSEVVEQAKENRSFQMDSSRYGEGMSYSFEVLTDRKLSEDDRLFDDVERTCGEEPTDAYCIMVKLVFSGSNKKEETKMRLYTVEIDDNWYVYSDSGFIPPY